MDSWRGSVRCRIPLGLSSNWSEGTAAMAADAEEFIAVALFAFNVIDAFAFHFVKLILAVVAYFGR